MKKFLVILVSIVLIISLVVSAGIGLKGYNLYKETMKDVDISEVIDGVRAKENYVTIDQVPSDFINAIVAVEDHRFMSHKGFDVISFGRAILRNIKENEYAAGGSTITQQLSKNLFFSFEKKLERKVAELIVARQLEDMYSKNDILELYINIIYYGDGFEGFHDAAMGYFSKHPKDLSRAECVILAGLPQAPSAYALIENLDKGLERANQVVEAMIEHDFITSLQGDTIKLELENIKLQIN